MRYDLIHPSRKFDSVIERDDGVMLICSKPLLPFNGIFMWWATRAECEEASTVTSDSSDTLAENTPDVVEGGACGIKKAPV